MKKKPAIELSEEFVPGEHISLEDWQDWNLAISEHGFVHFYLGSLFEDGRLFSVSAVARRGKEQDRPRLVELNRGCLSLGNFFGVTTRYKILQDHLVRLPRGPDPYFAVLQRGSDEEDEVLTRQLFGSTYRQLNDFLNVFAAVVDGYRSPYDRFPRTTFSKTQDNDCDLTGVWIPCEFPYIAFTSSQYFKGHVSLYGFYRLLAFLCNPHVQINVMPGNHFYQELIVAGADQAVLDYLIESGNSIFHPLTL